MAIFRRVTAAVILTLALMSPLHAAQNTLTTPSSPLTMAGLASFLNNALTTVATNYSGATPPAVCTGGTACTYQFWLDTSAAPRVLRTYDGAQWVFIGSLDTASHAFSIPSTQTVSAQTGTSYAIVDANRGQLLTQSNVGASAYSLPQAGAASLFQSGWWVDHFNLGAGTETLTPTTSTINGASSLTLKQGRGVRIVSDGTNYQAVGYAPLTDTGSGAMVLQNTPTLITPVLGVATATSINGLTITSTTGTLTISNGKTLGISNSITLTAGADGQSYALPAVGDTIVTLGATQTLTAKTLTAPTINGGTHVGITSLGIRNAGTGAFDMTLAYNGTLTAGRTLTVDIGDTSRSIGLAGNVAILGAFTTAAAFTQAGAFATTITSTAISNATLPAGTHTLAGLDVVQTWSAAQSIGSGFLKLNGATSGALTVNCAAICGSNTLTLPAGTTDFSATGGTSRFVAQLTVGGALTVAQPAFTDINGQIANAQVSGSYTGITGTGALAAGSATTGFTINAALVSLSGQFPGNAVVAVADASGSPSTTFGVVKCDGTTTICAGGVISAVGTVTSITCATTLTCTASNPITGAGTIALNLTTANSWSGLITGTNGLVINGNAVTTPPLTPTSSAVLLVGADAAAAQFNIYSYGAITAHSQLRSNGTAAAPTALLSGDQMYQSAAGGHNGTALVGARAAVRMAATENWGVGSNGANVTILTTPNGSATLTEAARFHQSGGFSVGTTTDPGIGAILANTSIKATTTLTVAGMANVATTSAVCINTGTGLLTYDGTVGTCTVSDERLKNMGDRIPNALDRLLRINGVYYTWKDPSYGVGRQIGVGAQTVERVFPELVSTDSKGTKSVDYQRLVAPIIEALRELKADNDNLRHQTRFKQNRAGR